MNVGVTFPVTLISIVAMVAHPDVVGVNVYFVIPIAEVFITEGLHVPVILLFDNGGNAGAAEFRQTAGIGVNVGVTWLLIVIFIV